MSSVQAPLYRKVASKEIAIRALREERKEWEKLFGTLVVNDFKLQDIEGFIKEVCPSIFCKRNLMSKSVEERKEFALRSDLSAETLYRFLCNEKDESVYNVVYKRFNAKRGNYTIGNYKDSEKYWLN